MGSRRGGRNRRVLEKFYCSLAGSWIHGLVYILSVMISGEGSISHIGLPLTTSSNKAVVVALQ